MSTSSYALRVAALLAVCGLAVACHTENPDDPVVLGTVGEIPEPSVATLLPQVVITDPGLTS